MGDNIRVFRDGDTYNTMRMKETSRERKERKEVRKKKMHRKKEM